MIWRIWGKEDGGAEIERFDFESVRGDDVPILHVHIAWFEAPESLRIIRGGTKIVQLNIEIVVVWDDPRKPGETLRVLGAIDAWRFPAAFAPLTWDFHLNPDGLGWLIFLDNSEILNILVQ